MKGRWRLVAIAMTVLLSGMALGLSVASLDGDRQ